MRILELNLQGINPIIHFLKDEGFVIDHAEDVEDAVSLIKYGHEYQAVLYTEHLAHQFRRAGLDIPLICFTGVPSTEFKVTELNAGCDCVLVYPFDKREVLAFVHATIRRCHRYTANTLKLGPVGINFDAEQIEVNGKEVRLTVNEWKVFEVLARHHKRCVATESIYFQMYEDDRHADGGKLIDVYVCKINKKFKTVLGYYPIQCVWGRGRILDIKEV